MTDYSIGESDSLVLKAYRGAGFSWGLAQEAGSAAAWMAIHGLPAFDQFACLLSCIDNQSTEQLTPLANDETVWSSPAGLLCPVISGVAFSESNLQKLAMNKGITLRGVQQPLISLPFIAYAAKRLNTDLRMTASGYRVICDKQGQGIEIAAMPNDHDPLQAFNSDIEICVATTGVAPGFRWEQRASCETESLQLLNKLAHRTYVPATEESRSGAGAGLLDND